MALKPRTGNQYVISSGEWSAVVTELGASLRELKWRGEDLIVPFDPNKVIPCCNGWVLAPYPNRVTNGQYSFDGEDYQMPIDEFDRQSSLHGYAYRYMWELVDLQESHVTLSWRSPDIAGYPFDITITATYALDENGLTETINSWQVCTGNEIGEKARQAGVAVEPMTAYADAFRTGKDLVVLEPDDDYTTVVTFHAEQI